MSRPSTLRARIKRQTRLGEMFRLYRTVRGLSLRDLAPEIGIELKPTYYRQAVKNIEAAETQWHHHSGQEELAFGPPQTEAIP